MYKYNSFRKQINEDGSATAFEPGTSNVLFHVRYKQDFDAVLDIAYKAYYEGHEDGAVYEKARLRAKLGL